MKVPSITLAIVCVGAALSGCVSYGGNTHALLTPIGVVGYHTFKPPGAERVVPPELKLPDRVAATNQQPAQPEEDGDQT